MNLQYAKCYSKFHFEARETFETGEVKSEDIAA